MNKIEKHATEILDADAHTYVVFYKLINLSEKKKRQTNKEVISLVDNGRNKWVVKTRKNIKMNGDKDDFDRKFFVLFFFIFVFRRLKLKFYDDHSSCEKRTNDAKQINFEFSVWQNAQNEKMIPKVKRYMIKLKFFSRFHSLPLSIQPRAVHAADKVISMWAHT